MKELTILSGKGGSGKTSVTAAFATLLKNKVLCDADVDAADLHLLAQPQSTTRTPFVSGRKAWINPDSCTQCGKCRELCRFDAISEDFVVNSLSCEGCAVCTHFCPENAIAFNSTQCGEWMISETRFGTMVHAQLKIGEENSGKLVTLIREQAKKIAAEKQIDFILTDGAPGIGCPVISSMTGTTAILIVSEATVTGKHDMERVIELARHFHIPTLVCVNKANINQEITASIEQLCQSNKIPFLGQIPFDASFPKAMIQGKSIIEYGDSPATKKIRDIFQKTIEML